MTIVYLPFNEQGKTGKNGTHGNENLASYSWYFGSFDEKRTYIMSWAYFVNSSQANA